MKSFFRSLISSERGITGLELLACVMLAGAVLAIPSFIYIGAKQREALETKQQQQQEADELMQDRPPVANEPSAPIETEPENYQGGGDRTGSPFYDSSSGSCGGSSDDCGP